MSNEEKERRCKSCGKLLLDEKLPYCRRCVLERRNKGAKIGGLAMTVLGAFALVNNNSDVNNTTA